jgi:hypothetical protein
METVPEDFKAIAQSVLQLVQQRWKIRLEFLRNSNDNAVIYFSMLRQQPNDQL